jgi:hypothetical protein
MRDFLGLSFDMRCALGAAFFSNWSHAEGAEERRGIFLFRVGDLRLAWMGYKSAPSLLRMRAVPAFPGVRRQKGM